MSFLNLLLAKRVLIKFPSIFLVFGPFCAVLKLYNLLMFHKYTLQTYIILRTKTH
jgi:hypothetical protein